ncbi:copper amine oxidase N-terminal domain-containing protein [Paenibacillus sp. Marseille-Q4541]|uniref:copper amine oxidase N-terminal domain-containing protein n=1 Tax=Paenibacillus sp. Marseille-Q4541 TaxID=2831522 RepID=UPI001BA7AA04|nr:copper amine oxidase N-terminal domain-containing protein [Paenibacillus sp. Marseille-Q4541]
MKNKMKTGVAAAALTVALGGSSLYAYADASTPVPISSNLQETVTITVNGQAIEDGYQISTADQPMIPVRSLAEALGMELTWVKDTKASELTKGNVWTSIATGKDQYNVNKMLVTLGQAPEIVNNIQYVPLNFVSKVLHGNVNVEGSKVTITTDNGNESEQEVTKASGVITSLNNYNGNSSIHINGYSSTGIVLNVGEDTEFVLSNGNKLELKDLKVGDQVDVEHAMFSTLSLPPQSPVYKITVTEQADAEMVVAEGSIGEVRNSDAGELSFLVKGTGEEAANDIVFQIGENTKVVNTKGEEVDPSTLKKDDYVIGFHNGVTTRSLPPIANAMKIVVDQDRVAE